MFLFLPANAQSKASAFDVRPRVDRQRVKMAPREKKTARVLGVVAPGAESSDTSSDDFPPFPINRTAQSNAMVVASKLFDVPTERHRTSKRKRSL